MIEIKGISNPVLLKLDAKQKEIFRVIGTTDVDGKGTEHEVKSIDPFIFLDEALIHEPGTTFSPHPHAGLAAVSYIFSGEIKAWDNLNGESPETNEAGGLYFINSGRGVVHSEVAIKPTHWLQMWINPGIYQSPLPQAHSQLVKPDAIPMCHDKGVSLRVLIGEAYDCKSPVISDWPILYMHVVLEAGSTKTIELEHENWNGFIYVIKGSGQFGSDETEANYQHLLEFDTNDSTSLKVSNSTNTGLEFMLALGKPHDKDFVKLLGHGGAIVADTEEHARSAMSDFEADSENFGS